MPVISIVSAFYDGCVARYARSSTICNNRSSVSFTCCTWSQTLLLLQTKWTENQRLDLAASFFTWINFILFIRHNKFWWCCSLCAREGHWSASLKSNFVGFHIVRAAIRRHCFRVNQMKSNMHGHDWWINKMQQNRPCLIQMSDQIPKKLVRCSNITSYPSQFITCTSISILFSIENCGVWRVMRTAYRSVREWYRILYRLPLCVCVKWHLAAFHAKLCAVQRRCLFTILFNTRRLIAVAQFNIQHMQL